ncbi:MAG TPA: Rubrerythrin, partial [Armatimonadota bacterium]|nr:Rubrerythrin [Armatimonadota bacterium]
MPEFTNPFIGTVPRQMTHEELVRAIMLNISAEFEAVHLYLAHRDATSNEDARKVLYDIALEELV